MARLRARAQIVVTFREDEMDLVEAIEKFREVSNQQLAPAVKQALRAALFGDPVAVASVESSRPFSKATVLVARSERPLDAFASS